MTTELPVAVIGGGPIGLAAAAHLLSRGVAVKLYEAGNAVATNVRDWGHVRLFSPWRFNIDAAARAILRQHGWQEPQPDGLPTGHELFEAYLAPLAMALMRHGIIETKARVRSITRHGIDKVVSRDRVKYPFALAIDGQSSGPRIDIVRAVVDASGTWQCPNPLGASGTPALGEKEADGHIAYRIPDVFQADRAEYAGKHTLVIGGGHSAANLLLDLCHLADDANGTRVTWAVRSSDLNRIFGGGVADKLPARGKLGIELKRLVEAKRLDLVRGFSTHRVDRRPEGVHISGTTLAGGATLGPFDRIVALTGQRPDLSITRELRLDLDPWLECPRTLGPMIDPNLHSCGTVPPHGYRELSHPEQGYFAVGIKSYGRAPTFLMATGYEQVRSIAALLSGDERAASEVRLVLQETGVCSVNVAPAESTGCCGGTAPETSDACCVADHLAKETGATGCGCSEAAAAPAQQKELATGIA